MVDPDDHHLFVSLGCAAENFLIAAEAHGRPGAAAFDNAGDGRVEIDLTTAAPRASALYTAIPARQSTRTEYDGREVPPDDIKRLEIAAAIDGVSTLLITDEVGRNAVLDHVVAANSVQLEDPAFVRELQSWIRFNPSQAIRTGDGLFGAASGNPNIPTWLGNRIFRWLLRKDAENAKYSKQLRSSAGVAVFVGEHENRQSWFKVGLSFQRFALQATALGIRTAHINQPIEVPSIRRCFSDWLGAAGVRPDLVIRFGYAPPLPMSMRRSVDHVLVSGI